MKNGGEINTTPLKTNEVPKGMSKIEKVRKRGKVLKVDQGVGESWGRGEGRSSKMRKGSTLFIKKCSVEDNHHQEVG